MRGEAYTDTVTKIQIYKTCSINDSRCECDIFILDAYRFLSDTFKSLCLINRAVQTARTEVLRSWADNRKLWQSTDGCGQAKAFLCF